MLTDEKINELLKPAFNALRAAMREAYSEGGQAMVDTLLETAARLKPSPAEKPNNILATLAPLREAEAADQDEGDGKGSAKRAPKGLVEQVLEQVLRDKPGMTQEEVEAAVVAADGRIAVKSVYNKLRHFERLHKRFKRFQGRWYRMQDVPRDWASSSLDGETGDVGSPAPNNPHSKAGQPDGPGLVEHEKIN